MTKRQQEILKNFKATMQNVKDIEACDKLMEEVHAPELRDLIMDRAEELLGDDAKFEAWLDGELYTKLGEETNESKEFQK